MKYILIFILLVGCSPATKLRRAERLINAAIEGGAKVSRDTVYVNKKVYIPKHVLDSNVYFRNVTDTVIVTKDRIVTKVKISKDSIYIHTECPDSTIVIRVPVEVERTIKAGTTFGDVVKICVLVAGVSILLTILVLSRRKRSDGLNG